MGRNEDETRKIVQDVSEFTDRQIRRLGVRITRILRGPPGEGGTPVDTGWASSNWIPSIGQPVTEPYGSKLAVDRSRSNAGIASLATYKKEQGPIFIANNVPYINLLNTGSSRQAPPAFVDIAVQRALNEKSRQ